MKPNDILKLASLFSILAENSSGTSKILKNIEQLDTHTARKEYAEDKLKHLSSGSSRLVYLTPEHTVVKLAKNDKGLAQNRAEANPKMQSKFLNPIISHADNFSWIQTHFLEKITSKQFEKMTHIPFDDFAEAIRFALKDVSENSEITKPKDFDKVSDSDIFKEMKRIGEQFRLMPGDLARISSWGEKDNHPILIDAGLTADVFQDFYEDTKSSSTKS